MREILFALTVASGVLQGLLRPARGHDIYGQLFSGGSPGVGQWCCSGDQATGDCEALGAKYALNPNGSVDIVSRRYGAAVHVAASKVTWLAVPGGENSEAHWCGKMRKDLTTNYAAISREQPDPNAWTYCMFIAPGGM